MQIAEKYKGDKNNLIQNLSKEEDYDTEIKDDEEDMDEFDEIEGVELGSKAIRYFEVEITPNSSLGIYNLI